MWYYGGGEPTPWQSLSRLAEEMTPDWILAGCAIASSIGSAIYMGFRLGTIVERIKILERDVTEIKTYVIPPPFAGAERRHLR